MPEYFAAITGLLLAGMVWAIIGRNTPIPANASEGISKKQQGLLFKWSVN